MDYKFSGAGTIPAGEYEAVKVSGAAKLAGDVRCTSLSASGSFGGKLAEALKRKQDSDEE